MQLGELTPRLRRGPYFVGFCADFVLLFFGFLPSGSAGCVFQFGGQNLYHLRQHLGSGPVLVVAFDQGPGRSPLVLVLTSISSTASS